MKQQQQKQHYDKQSDHPIQNNHSNNTKITTITTKEKQTIIERHIK